jgi:hypothetical protein
MGSIARATKPFCRQNETRLKPMSARLLGDPTRGLIMVAFIINLFYRQSCRAALSAIRMQSQIRL